MARRPVLPAGFHPASTSVAVVGGHGARARRIVVEDPAAYWRPNMAALFAGTPAARAGAAGTARGTAGPQGLGERWDVQLVQVNTTGQLGAPPGTFAPPGPAVKGLVPPPPPPPVVAQVWLAVSGQAQHLLGQTTAGGQDDIGVSAPPLTPGEQVLVLWFNVPAGQLCWAIIRGVRYVLDL